MLKYTKIINIVFIVEIVFYLKKRFSSNLKILKIFVMFTLEPTFTFPMQSEALVEHAESIRKILIKIIPEELFFEDKADFIDWIVEALPAIKWTECKDLPDTLSVLLLCHSCEGLNIENFFLNHLRSRLVPEREVTILAFQHMSFHLKEISSNAFFVAEVKILIEDSRDFYFIQKNLPLLAKEISLGVTSVPYANYLLSSKKLSYPSKVTLIHQELHQVMRKYPNHIDALVFEELGKLLTMTDDEFVNQRKPRHISRIVCTTYLIRKELFRAMTLFSGGRHLCLKLFRASLYFPFSSKSVLGLLVGINMMDKYELFDEEHMLLAVQKWIPQAQLVQGATTLLENGRDKLKILYIELEKRDRTHFSIQEVRLLKESLKEELKHRIERLVPAIFMIRNEEEVLRNILTLSREIHRIDDLPQVMISLDQQTVSEVSFTVILVWIAKKGRDSLQHAFEKLSGNFLFQSDRVQIVGYLRKKYPIEAHVFRLNMTKDISLLRADSSLNFYVARQEVSSLLFQAIGEFRDYNGGIIVKQGEILSQFKQSFQGAAGKFPDLLENFFYSITPIEKQATLSFEVLKILFDLFLEASKADLAKKSSYSIKSSVNERRLFVIVRAKDPSFKGFIAESLDTGGFSTKEIVSTSGNFQTIFFAGYVVEGMEKYDSFIKCVQEAMTAWQKKIDSLRTLKLALQFPVISLDPRIAGDESSATLLRLLFDGLMRFNREGKVEFAMASSVDISEDRKNYIFHLREACWSNGAPVIAYNFEYAWKKILSPDFKTVFFPLFYPIKNAKAAKHGLVSMDEIGVRAIDDHTLEVELEFPVPYFLELTTHTQYLPVNHHVDQLHPNWSLQAGEHFVCNGAYRPGINNPTQGYELVKNPTYWEAKDVQIDQIILTRSSGHNAYQMFRKGEVDWIGPPFVSWDPAYTAGEGDKIVSSSSEVCSYWYVFNTQKFPFHHPKLRKAFGLAVDRNKVIAGLQYTMTPALSPLLKGHTGFPQDERFIQGNPAKAIELFEEALKELGLTRQTFPVVTLVFAPGAFREHATNVVKSEWENVLGIQCRVETHDWALIFRKLTQNDFQVAGVLWRSLMNDPIYTLNFFRSASDPINFSRWEMLSFQRLLDSADRELDLNKRAVYLQKAEEILINEMPVLPAFYTRYHSLVKKHIVIDYTDPIGIVNLRWAFLKNSEN